MGHPEGAGSQRADGVNFDRRVRVEFRGAQIGSNGELLVMRELDDALGLSDLAATALRDTRRGKTTIHRLDGLFRQSVFGLLAGYEDVNDADCLALDPVMRQVVGARAVDAQAASCATADDARDKKRLCSRQIQAIFTSGGTPLGECRVR